MNLQDYLALPWTVHGRAMRDDGDGSIYYVFTIEELPGFSAVGRHVGRGRIPVRGRVGDVPLGGARERQCPRLPVEVQAAGRAA